MPFLFHTSAACAEASALVYSVIETAKANNLNVFQYLYVPLLYMPEYKDDYGTVKQLSLTPQIRTNRKPQYHFCPSTFPGLRQNLDPHLGTQLFAKIQPHTCRAFLFSSVCSGKSFFKNPRQILLANAHTVISNYKRYTMHILFCINTNPGPYFTSVFGSI